MQLFKRVLLSLFPDEIVAQTINPASMFISFISTKEFFSVINRKIVENYKLNLFDINLDPFEFKLGFGETNTAKQKNIDTYYGYCATANLNGYRFFSPANIANSISLIVAIYIKDIFRKYHPDYYLNFLYTIFLLIFVFLARIKIFPYEDREKNYNRFIEIIFSFYEFVFQETRKKSDPLIIKNLKKELLNQSELFFVLFDIYKKCNTIFVSSQISNKDIYYRIFYDELKSNLKPLYTEFIDHHEKYVYKKIFSDIETKILQSILPADILLRYLFLDTDMFLITESVISKIFDKQVLDNFIKNFHKDNSQLEQFLLYITDYRHFKKNFFAGVQKYIITIFREQDNKNLFIKEDLDDLMSSIGDDIENIESFKIPERIKKESKMMEKILNFYITFIGGFWVSRGDNFFLRLFRTPIIEKIISLYQDSKTKENTKEHTFVYYGGLLYQYHKNVFFYKHTAENVRAGKQKFILPLKNDIKNIYATTNLLKLFDQSFIATILQDINPKDIRLYIKNKKIIDLFKSSFGDAISHLAQKNKKDCISFIYSGIATHLENKKFLSIIIQEFTDQDIYHIKENIYNLDYWINNFFLQALTTEKIVFKNFYSDLAILGIFATLRETLFGFMIYMTYITHESQKRNIILHEDILFKIYIQNILIIDEYTFPKIQKVINILLDTFGDIISYWIEIDDNKEYLTLGYENRLSFIENLSHEDIKKKIISEDTIRFKGFLKNITYYNKRFIIPQS